MDKGYHARKGSMGLYDRDYMREPRPSPAPGGRIGLVIFLALLLALAIYLRRAHPGLVPRFIADPWSRLSGKLFPRRGHHHPRRNHAARRR